MSSSLSPMSRQSKVFVLLLAGDQHEVIAFVQRRYTGRETVIWPKIGLRESGWKNQLRKLRELNGEALVIFTDSLESLQEPMLFKWTVLVHRCRETVLADSSGSFEATRKMELIGLLPRFLMAALADVIVLACAWIGLQLFQIWLKFGRAPEARAGRLDLAFLYPSQAGLDVPGGGLTHVTGFLSGLAREGASCLVFSGRPLQASFDVHRIPGSRHLHLFREAATLSYNFRFISAAR